MNVERLGILIKRLGIGEVHLSLIVCPDGSRFMWDFTSFIGFLDVRDEGGI
jgi:hypothetical protein